MKKKYIILIVFIITIIIFIVGLIIETKKSYDSLEESFDSIYYNKKDKYYIKDGDYYYIWDGEKFYTRQYKNKQFYTVGGALVSSNQIDSDTNAIYINKTKKGNYYLVIITNKEDNDINIDDKKIEPLKRINDDKESNNIFGYIDKDNKKEYNITINDEKYIVTNYFEN